MCFLQSLKGGTVVLDRFSIAVQEPDTGKIQEIQIILTTAK